MKHQLKHNVFIVDGLRTATGSPFKSLKKYSPAELAAAVIRSLLRKTKVKKKCIDEVLIANVVGAGQGQNLARQAALAGGLPVSVPAVTVNNVCGAGLQAVVFGARAPTFAGFPTTIPTVPTSDAPLPAPLSLDEAVALAEALRGG